MERERHGQLSSIALLLRPANRRRPRGPNFLCSAAFSPDGKEIATASATGLVGLWDASTHRHIWTDFGSGKSTTSFSSAAFSPDGKEIITITGDVGLIWSAAGDQGYGTVIPPPVGLTALSSAKFSPDGKEIVTASSDGTARIWSSSTHRQLGVLTEPGDSALNGAAFSPDGKEIVTASSDGTARIWSTTSRQQLTVLVEPGNETIRSAAFSPDGKEIVTASCDDGTARIWSTELAGAVPAIERIAESRVTREFTPGERKTYLAGI